MFFIWFCSYICYIFLFVRICVIIETKEGFCIMWCSGSPVFFNCSTISIGPDWWAMQRSRRALLQRRALEKAIGGRTRLYKVSLSLVFVLWGLIFLFSLWISHGHGYRGKLLKLYFFIFKVVVEAFLCFFLLSG